MEQLGEMPDSWRKLKRPEKRAELISLLSELSDKETQERLWIRHEDFPNASGIDEVFHFLFDDTDLAGEPRTLIGSILVNEREAEQIELLTDLLSQMLDRIGDRNSLHYINDDDWPLVIAQAKSALQQCRGNTK